MLAASCLRIKYEHSALFLLPHLLPVVSAFTPKAMEKSSVSHLSHGDLPKQQRSNEYKLKMPYLITVILSPSSVHQSFCAFQAEAPTELKSPPIMWVKGWSTSLSTFPISTHCLLLCPHWSWRKHVKENHQCVCSQSRLKPRETSCLPLNIDAVCGICVFGSWRLAYCMGWLRS